MVTAIPGFYTTHEAAVLLKRTPETICRYIRKKQLPHRRVGREILIPVDAVQGFTPPLPGNPKLRK